MKVFYMSLLMAAFGANVAHAADLFCQKQDVVSTVTLSSENDIYTVSVSGSRNDYSATYKVVKQGPTRVGYHFTLEKVSDQSTWNDMPQTLVVNHFVTPAYITLGTGLPFVKTDWVHFSETDCAPPVN